jgi:glycosyltransferase involved in cell wall biosynthesis
VARIVSVYQGWVGRFAPHDMSFIRWLKIAEALARQGHEVDIATREPRVLFRNRAVRMAPRLRRVPLSSVRWGEYDVVKTVFHAGFETLRRYGGADHPFIIAKLGSVVGGEDLPGVYFYGEQREELFAIQERIRDRARYVTVLSRQGGDLWRQWHGDQPELLLVPGGVDEKLPRVGRSPYRQEETKTVLFAGNIYSPSVQPEAHEVLVDKLNELGRLLIPRSARLHFLGTGDTRRLDREVIRVHGSVPYRRSWPYLWFADVGVVVSAGKFMHNNESTKLYHYLRAGLPIVSESGFPNDGLVVDSGHGRVVASGSMARMADAVAEVAAGEWDRQAAIDFVLCRYTWDRRCETYRQILPG